MNRAIEEKDLTQSIAVYVSKYCTAVSEVSDWIEKNEEYVRVTEPLEVEFTPLPDEVVLDLRVKSIDREIEKTRAELTRKIEELTDQKNRLLAITHQPLPAHSGQGEK